MTMEGKSSNEKTPMDVEKVKNSYIDTFYSVRTAKGDEDAKHYLEVVLNDIIWQINEPEREHEFLGKYSKEDLEKLHDELKRFSEQEQVGSSGQ